MYSWHERTAGLDILPSVDRLRLMVYDWSVGQAGPVSPMSWVNNVLNYVQRSGASRSVAQGADGCAHLRAQLGEGDRGLVPVQRADGTVAVQMENMAGLLAKPGAALVRDD